MGMPQELVSGAALATWLQARGHMATSSVIATMCGTSHMCWEKGINGPLQPTPGLVSPTLAAALVLPTNL